jgi:hypothetical protein
MHIQNNCDFIAFFRRLHQCKSYLLYVVTADEIYQSMRLKYEQPFSQCSVHRQICCYVLLVPAVMCFYSTPNVTCEQLYIFRIREVPGLKL